MTTPCSDGKIERSAEPPAAGDGSGNSTGAVPPPARTGIPCPGFSPEDIPHRLSDPGSEWVVWGRPVADAGDPPDKSPRSPREPFERVRVNDPHWFGFEECVGAVKASAGRLLGVGRVMTAAADGIVGIDLDRVLGDPRGEDFVRRLLESMPDGYFEVSPSGRGIRGFVYAPDAVEAFRKANRTQLTRSDWPFEGCNVELYAQERGGRHLTVTGQVRQAGDLSVDSSRALLSFAQELSLPKAIGHPSMPEAGIPTDRRFTTDQLEALLPLLAHRRVADRHQWIRVGLACKGAGLSFDTWDRFSRRCVEKYAPDECRRVWESFEVELANGSWIAAMAKEDSPESFRQVAGKFKRGRRPAKSPRNVSDPNPTATRSDPAGSEGADPVEHPDRPVEESATEFTCLEGFVYRYRPLWRWIPERGQWIEWRNHWWRCDDRGRIAELGREAVRESFPPRLHSLARAEAIVNSAKRALGAPLAEFDANPDIIGVGETGREQVVDLRTGRCRKGTPDDLLMRSTGISPGGDCSQWNGCLRDWTRCDEELAEYLQMVAGYCLTGSVDLQQFWILHGSGEDGKSTFLETIASAMGPYAGSFNLSAVLANDREVHPTSRAKLRGLRLAYTSECNSRTAWNEAAMKSLTGGDRITARYMYQDEFDFSPTHKFIIATNQLPEVCQGGKSWSRRVRVIPFHKPHKPRGNLRSELSGELPGILAWMIDGARKVLAKTAIGQGLAAPKAVLEASRQYEFTEDWFAACIAERFELNDQEPWFTSTQEMIDQFHHWAVTNRTGQAKAINARMLSHELAGRFGLRSIQSSKGDRARGWVGIRIRQPK
jgi:putative DNA primase/helicase